jgi:DNA-directed RNA polymerase specialized sigma24 family protein
MREIARLYWIDDLTAPEVATLLDIVESTVRTQTSRAAARLRADLREYESGEL